MNNRKIRVLHLIESFGIGGLENGLVNLINHSDPSKFHHEICCIKSSGKASQRLSYKINIHEMRKKEGNSWGIVANLARLMQALNPDIVHTRNWGAADGIFAAIFARVPHIVHSEHGWNNSDLTTPPLRRRLVRRLLSPFVDRFVAVSHDIGGWLNTNAWIPNNKILTIMNGVDTNKFYPDPEAKAKKEPYYDADLLVGTVSRLDPIKNCDLIIEAFSSVTSDGHNIKLMIVGDGPERQRLENLAQTLAHSHRIMFLGERDDLPDLYRSMDIFLLTSRNEGLSNTILEAMASGLPTIATCVGGNPELVAHQKTGLLIQADNREAIKDALLFYLNNRDERIRHGINARNEAVHRFSLDRMVRTYESLYEDLIARSHDRKPQRVL